MNTPLDFLELAARIVNRPSPRGDFLLERPLAFDQLERLVIRASELGYFS